MLFKLGYLRDHRNAIPTLARWHHEQWAWCTPHLTIDDRIRGFEDRVRYGEIPTGLVALVDDTIVGLACLVAQDLKSRPDLTPWLASVFVAVAFRGHGVGSALSERTTEEAMNRLFLVTFNKVSFYSRLGWSVLEPTTYANTPATIMTKDLTRLGWNRLFLVTFNKVSFYSRLGWSVLEPTTYANTPATIMTKDLTRAEKDALVVSARRRHH